jgi:uncharacterized protein
LNSSRRALIVFQKNAKLGNVKTRLAKDLGDELALKVYLALISLTYHVLNDLNDIDIWVYFSESVQPIPLNNPQLKIFKEVQQGGDLGEKMKNAFEEVFENGYEQIAIIGTDCPEISAKLINEAFNAMAHTADLVIGEALDGGYYLLGMKSFLPKLFQNIPWSSSAVAKETILKIEQLNLKYFQLPVLRDLDEMEDWEQTKDLLKPFLP